MSDKAIVRVRIDYEDDTYRELTDRGACERWAAMAESQAVIAFTHGRRFDPVPWVEGVSASRTEKAET